MNLLLDTCSLLWLTDDPTRFPNHVRKPLNDSKLSVHVSAVSALELGIKLNRGKLELNQPISTWFSAVCREYALEIIPLDAEAAALSTELPPIHTDPFDRILVATALIHHLALVTPDKSIHQYPKLKILW